MIVMNLLSIATNIIRSIFGALNFVSLPFDFMTVLLDIFCYGTWVIGADLMGIVLATITGWLGAKFTIGLVLFVWRLLPLT